MELTKQNITPQIEYLSFTWATCKNIFDKIYLSIKRRRKRLYNIKVI